MSDIPLASTIASTITSHPGACERCYRYKERCSFDTAQKTCSRCSALGEKCRPRLKKRMGRRPVAHKLPYGTTSVMQLFKDPVHGDQLVGDATYPTPSCRRSNRPNSAVPLRISRVNHVLENPESFFQVHRTFMLGRSFVVGFQSAVRRLFARSPQLLTDAYAVALNLMGSRHAASPGLDGEDLAIGARCLQTLMAGSSSIKEPEDAAVIVLLGQALLVYNTLVPSPATQVITRGTLLSVKHWYAALMTRPYLDAVTLTPVLVDMVECLIRRDVPVVCLPDTNRCIVDRFLGVCSSLLPLLYELCERSYQAKTTGQLEHELPSPEGEDVYSEIECKIHNWTPGLPQSFFATYSDLEAGIMLAQARSYRLATLLVIHRLRFPLGVEDRVGQSYADEILRELSILQRWPPDEATGLGLDFPLLVATLEMPGPGSEVYRAFEPLRFRRQHSRVILDFITFVTTARGNGYNGLWFDLVHGQLQGVTLT